MAEARRKSTQSSNGSLSDDTAEFQIGDMENTAQRNRNIVNILIESLSQSYQQNTEIHKLLAQMPEIMRQTNRSIEDLKSLLKDALDKDRVSAALRNKIFGVVKEPVGNIFYAISKFITVALMIAIGFLAGQCKVKLPVSAFADERMIADSELN